MDKLEKTVRLHNEAVMSRMEIEEEEQVLETALAGKRICEAFNEVSLDEETRMQTTAPLEMFHIQDAENNNPKNADTVGLRFNAGKNAFDLLPPQAMWELAKVYTAGAEKYEPQNWRKGMRFGICIGAAFRHIFKWMSGEKIDEETGCHHLAMVAWNCLAIVQWEHDGVGEDDRFIGEPLGHE